MDRSVWGIYLFSLLCWYLAILDNLEGSGEDFVENNRERERDMTADFNERMKGQKENG